MGGVGNPGSLKGYIPSFMGDDYGELVRDRGELREWIREGSLGRVNEHWMGGRYAKRQRIQMPAYKDIVKDEEIEPLMDFVEWVASGQIAHAPMS